MRLIGRAGGIVACRETPEEYIPDRPAPLQDLVNLVRATYQFANFPTFQPGMSPIGPFSFGAGRFVHGDSVFAINQLMMLPEGDIVATASTDDAELVLDHLMSLLDENLGFRLKQASAKRSYLSTVVVEFDNAFSIYIEKIGKMERAINDLLSESERHLKMLSFGREDLAVGGDQIALIENADFTIDRRAGQPFLSNRFFCVAPMRTNDHLRALEQIEAITRGDAT
jgi:hypothetical protein